MVMINSLTSMDENLTDSIRTEFEMTAKLLGVSFDGLKKALTTRSIEIAKNLVQIPLKYNQAVDCRDSLARHLYGELFDYLVKKINSIINDAKPPARPRTIGVLDIFGFELFEKNSFEQLCTSSSTAFINR